MGSFAHLRKGTAPPTPPAILQGSVAARMIPMGSFAHLRNHGGHPTCHTTLLHSASQDTPTFKPVNHPKHQRPMKPSLISRLVLLTVAANTAYAAGTPITWADSAGSTAWTSTTSWTGGATPTDDISTD